MIPSGSDALRLGRVLSRMSASTPSAAKRSCQRQRHGLGLPDRRRIAIVPSPPAVARMISAGQTNLAGVFRSLT